MAGTPADLHDAPAASAVCPVDHSAYTGTAAHHGYEPFDINDPVPAYERLRT